MTEFVFSATRPDYWDALCGQSGALFGSSAWQELLQRSFRCRTIYAGNGQCGYAISVFRAGPFEIGYLGFPAGGGIGELAMETEIIESLTTAKIGVLPTCVRIPMSSLLQRQALALPRQTNPESVIENLQAWNLDRVSKNLRRDIRKAERAGLAIEVADKTASGAELFGIYSHTVQRHRGALRYNETYFQELIGLAQTLPWLQVLIARRGADMAGFAVIARHGRMACYLHGGSSPEYRQSSPSDLLLNHAITDAQQQGCEQFNLMASPQGQPSLVKYKEKWGATTRDLNTYTVPLRRTYPLFRIAERLYGLIR